MNAEHARGLLDRIEVLRYPCDLDLLIFFARHPRTLMTSAHLAILLGYEFKQVDASLVVLRRAGLLMLSENPTYVARMYVFTPTDSTDGWLPDLLQLASTREGRLTLVRALEGRSAGQTGRQAVRAENEATIKGERPVTGPATLDAAKKPGSNKRPRGRME